MSEFNKNMDEIWNEIEEATDDIEVPESLLPENIVERLKKETKKEKRNKMQRMTELAAAVAVVIAIGGVGTNYYMSSSMKSSGTSMESATAMDSFDFYTESSMDSGTNAFTTQESVDEKEVVVAKKEKKQTIGDYYHLAKDYDEVYDKIKADDERYQLDYGVEDEAINSGLDINKEQSNSESMGMNSGAGIKDVAAANDSSYSTTNVQEEGIDESDIVKTDGKFVYRVWNNKVYIIDIQKKVMKKVGEINLKNSASDMVKEIYLDGDKLCVITECIDTKLDSGEEEVFEDSANVAPYYGKYQMNDFYSVNTKVSTKLSVYNIKNKENPVLEGEMIQDGSYYTSRKVNDMMYLFTRKNFGRFYTHYTDAIPYIQGKKIDADSIYIPEKYIRNELIIASVNMNQPEQVIDHMAIMGTFANIYMGQNAFYLYENEYVSDQSYTSISKFKYDKDGYMEGVNAASVKGDIEDTFAISEKKDTLRVLTTDWSATERVNQLYVLDNEMKLKGEIDDIAKGESIYAARYIGDMAYFITYRNTDPLFVADLSNPAKPKLLGSVKVSGFSDYLHPYGEDKILGIGYETDKDSQRIGVKLCMFDVSNPKKPKVLKTYVMKEADEISAAENYKCVLVDVKKNMIGFLIQDYDSELSYTYKVFSWKNGKFKQVFSKKLSSKDGWIDGNEVRGLHAGSKFYLVKEGTLTSYDMKKKYKKINSIKFK